MLKMTLSFPSMSLLRPVQIHVGLPNGVKTSPPYPVVWALHCAVKDGAFFFDELGAAELVDAEKMAIVAPSLGNGYYVNSVFDAQADFLNEILHALPETLPLSRERQYNVALGISMGGFGAMRWALQSHAFAKVTSISGVFDCHIKPDVRIVNDRVQRALHATFEKNMERLLLDDNGQTLPDADLGMLMDKAGTDCPSIRLYCGRQDYLAMPHNIAFMNLCNKKNMPARIREEDGGHDVEYWRRAFHEAFGDRL